MKNVKMATGSGSVTEQKWLLSCGTLMIGSSIVLGWASQVLAVNIPAGPIWSNDDARRVCPAVCTAQGAPGMDNGQL